MGYRNWRKHAKEESTLEIYYKYKTEIKEIKWYNNKEDAKLMINARLNTLDLNWRNKIKNESTKCELCNNSNENLEHFILHCEQYKDIRRQYTFMQQPYKQDTEEHIAEILLLKEERKQTEEKKIYIQRIWKLRQEQLKTRQRQQQD